jgi:GNAT superfamily N-acetyltransferase
VSDVKIRELGQPGDLGWVVLAHGEMYAAELGWDTTFEAMVAGVVGDYAHQHDPDREAGWIAEVDGERAGCIMCVADRDDPGCARLRVLLVDPARRGLGLGAALVQQCVDFARAAGYSRMRLWTTGNLASARRIYQAAGFELLDEQDYHAFGHDLVGQTWELTLAP